MEIIEQITPHTGPKLLLDWRAEQSPGRVAVIGAASIALNFLLAGLAMLLASVPPPHFQRTEEALNLHKATILYDPPQPLTQKEPNRQKPAKEVKLENLLPHPEVPQHTPTPPAPPPRVFQPPAANPQPVPKPSNLTLPEPPSVVASAKPPQILPPSPSPLQPPPPPAQTQNAPQLTLETPGQGGTSDTRGGGSLVPIPKTSVDDAVRSVARGAGAGGGIIVGDTDQMTSFPDPLHQTPSQGHTASTLELLSDAKGVDFKPYLIRILATVKRNWFAVIPESARLGRRGKVMLQFSIDRSGQVPKLVISMPSGAEALDRAAVAGISASVPFPPLPPEYKGDQIRLQFSFAYNMQ